MTTNESAQEEHEFVSGMEHQPEPIAAVPGYHDVTVTVLDSWARKIWRADGFIAHMLDSLSALGSKVLSVASPERGPEDYPKESDFERGVRAGSRKVSYNNGDAAPDRGNGEKRLLSWILGVVATLLAGGIFGGVAMYGKLASIEKGQDGHEQRINRLEADRDQRYRNSQPAAP